MNGLLPKGLRHLSGYNPIQHQENRTPAYIVMSQCKAIETRMFHGIAAAKPSLKERIATKDDGMDAILKPMTSRFEVLAG
jgi:hypothetical protein